MALGLARDRGVDRAGGGYPGTFADAAAATDLLRAMRASLGEGAMLLIGMDRIKDERVLVPAYDDAAGVTAAFNLNLLARTEPLRALAMLVLLFSLAGVPPMLGFFAKFGVLKAAVDVQMGWLSVLGVIASVIGAYYYLRIVYYMYFGTQRDTPVESRMGGAQWLALMGSAAAMIIGAFTLFGTEAAAERGGEDAAAMALDGPVDDQEMQRGAKHGEQPGEGFPEVRCLEPDARQDEMHGKDRDPVVEVERIGKPAR